MRLTERAILAVLTAIVTAGTMTACDQATSPDDRTTSPIEEAEPLIAVDRAAKTVAVTDPASPEKALVITLDENTRTQTWAYGEVMMVVGQGYVTTSAGSDLYEYSWQELDDARYLERYYVNGEALTLEIDGRPTDSQVQAYIDFYAANDTGLGDHPDLTQMADLWERAAPGVVTMARAADAPGAATMARAANAPGVATLPHSPGVPEPFLSSKAGYEDPELGLRGWLRTGCDVATICASIACRLAPITNPACWVCAGLAAGCAIASLFGGN